MTAPPLVNDYTAYGTNGTRSRCRPDLLGPMAQAQKHWIQAMIGEDTYVPFPYFYDVTAWSGPLLFNVTAVDRAHGWTLSRAGAPGTPSRRAWPRRSDGRHLAVSTISTSAYESEGWMRWLIDFKWRLPYRSIKTDRISRRARFAARRPVVPSGDAPAAYR